MARKKIVVTPMMETQMTSTGPVLVSAHWRTITLRNGKKVRFPITEHPRTNRKGSNRLSHEMNFPLWQREMLERLREQTEQATTEIDPDYVSPEQYAGTDYMTEQRRKRFLRERGKAVF